MSKILLPGNSLAVQWLELRAFTAEGLEGLGSIPGGGTMIPQATWCRQKKKNSTSCFSSLHSRCLLNITVKKSNLFFFKEEINISVYQRTNECPRGSWREWNEVWSWCPDGMENKTIASCRRLHAQCRSLLPFTNRATLQTQYPQREK